MKTREPELFAPEFYNTIKEPKPVLKELIKKASVQEDKILGWFVVNGRGTPFDVQNGLGMFGTPITSIRRAITNLTKNGLLEKTDLQRMGQYGKMNYLWKLK